MTTGSASGAAPWHQGVCHPAAGDGNAFADVVGDVLHYVKQRHLFGGGLLLLQLLLSLLLQLLQLLLLSLLLQLLQLLQLLLLSLLLSLLLLSLQLLLLQLQQLLLLLLLLHPRLRGLARS